MIVFLPAWLFLILIGVAVTFLGGLLLTIEGRDLQDIRSLGWALLVMGVGSIVGGILLFPRARRRKVEPDESRHRSRADEGDDVDDQEPRPRRPGRAE